MRFLLVSFSLLIITSVKANIGPMTTVDQKHLVKKLSYDIKKSLTEKGYTKAANAIELKTKKSLEEIISNNSEYEEELSKDQIVKARKCMSELGCEVYTIVSSFKRGPSLSLNQSLVLIDINTRKHEVMTHTVYSE